jgi:hypothetical protein
MTSNQQVIVPPAAIKIFPKNRTTALMTPITPTLRMFSKTRAKASLAESQKDPPLMAIYNDVIFG